MIDESGGCWDVLLCVQRQRCRQGREDNAGKKMKAQRSQYRLSIGLIGLIAVPRLDHG